ncbi:glycosyl transferase family 2 [Paenibacillus vortex V453]|uniref:Glycosyl transferase n=2 Tax=Paenibacillus TaxID=44249 RepID=A0A163LR98_9BACL|nr:MULTISPECIES: glycosyltransferase [Paenibacillus]AWP28144.1 glycosyl transferase [Paenibacillus sp. Cedars]EFU41229.1 glycosyl transferase family 2 [Paenibacillus vortex V453]KZS48380.1 glycosyl transferase [Paenibacillus glucanolyticus]MDH6672325.1 teichuronic acid biosynthesis glycosyltransferase TuaG [Paenibacillus sp. LBL]MPY16518.1 glycosyltransferase [Paenibacillus glucanolyticus]
MMPTVTIVIPFYNCQYIQQALESAVQQTYPAVEIIVVDDGSTQYSNLIAPYKNRIYYMGKSNGGTASALNHAILHASGQYIAWLSSDDRFVPQKIERQMAFMLSRGLDISFTGFSVINEHNRVTRPYEGIPMANNADLARQLVYSNPINGCTVIMKKDWLHRVGLFNAQLPYTHDYDLWIRLLMNGASFGFLPDMLTMYRVHSQMGTIRHKATIAREYEMVKNNYRHVLEHLAQHGG